MCVHLVKNTFSENCHRNKNADGPSAEGPTGTVFEETQDTLESVRYTNDDIVPEIKPQPKSRGPIIRDSVKNSGEALIQASLLQT